MTLLEREIIEKYHQLDSEAQKRVRDHINQDVHHDAPFDYDAWFDEINAIRAKIIAERGNVFAEMDAIAMLREIRDGEDDEE